MRDRIPPPPLRPPGLFGRAKLRRLGWDRRRGRFRLGRAARRETRDKPRAEKRHGLVAQIFGVGREVIAVALVEPEVEGLDKPARLDLLMEEPRVEQRQAVAAHRILRRQLLGVENKPAIDGKVWTPDRTDEHLPEEVAGPPVDLLMK